MADTKQSKIAKGGIGIAVAVILAWVARSAGMEVPPEVVAAVASIVGSVANSFKQG